MKEFSGDFALSLVKSIAYERMGGTPEELKAANTIATALKKAGLSPKLESFKITRFRKGKATLQVTSPVKKTYEALPVGMTKSTHPQGITADFIYKDTATKSALFDVKGKIVMLGGILNKDQYENLIKSKSAGFIRVCEPLRKSYFKIPDTYVRKTGNIPGISISFEHALELIKQKPKKVKIVSKQIIEKVTSHNVVTKITGTKYPKEKIVIVAHYDSVPLSVGVHDNAAGSAVIAEIARIFKAEPPARTVIFCWCGSEELGLLGSFAYAEKHKNSLKDVQMVFNADVGGAIIGTEGVIITGTEELKTYVELAAKEYGMQLNVIHDIISSDSVPFAEKGIPSINLFRSGGASFYIHSDGDSEEYIGADALATTGRFGLFLLRRLANAVDFPVKREIPETIEKKLENYLKQRLGRDYTPVKTRRK
ncbi:MAG: M28 family peptidase [Planctomycetota bacterium]